MSCHNMTYEYDIISKLLQFLLVEKNFKKEQNVIKYFFILFIKNKTGRMTETVIVITSLLLKLM